MSPHKNSTCSLLYWFWQSGLWCLSPLPKKIQGSGMGTLGYEAVLFRERRANLPGRNSLPIFTWSVVLIWWSTPFLYIYSLILTFHRFWRGLNIFSAQPCTSRSKPRVSQFKVYCYLLKIWWKPLFSWLSRFSWTWKDFGYPRLFQGSVL